MKPPLSLRQIYLQMGISLKSTNQNNRMKPTMTTLHLHPEGDDLNMGLNSKVVPMVESRLVDDVNTVNDLKLDYEDDLQSVPASSAQDIPEQDDLGSDEIWRKQQILIQVKHEKIERARERF